MSPQDPLQRCRPQAAAVDEAADPGGRPRFGGAAGCTGSAPVCGLRRFRGNRFFSVAHLQPEDLLAPLQDRVGPRIQRRKRRQDAASPDVDARARRQRRRQPGMGRRQRSRRDMAGWAPQ
jgi:hypothetical protein